MYIEQIEVSHFRENAETGKASCFVAFHTETGLIQMHCAVAEVTPADSRSALIAEALRQLGRMPEFRNGRNAPEFAPELTKTGMLAA